MKTAIRFFTVIAVLLAAAPAMAQIDTLAKQAIIVDANTGVVLLDKNADARMPTSSMSKVMTTYMAFEELKRGKLALTDKILVSEKAWRMQGSKMFIRVGDQVAVEDLIRGIVIQSGNDASVAIAEGIAGSEDAFVAAMNARAQEIGMTATQLRNASGWPDPDHYSTARDLAVLAYRIIHDFPEYYHYFAEREFTYNNIRQPNRDPLLGRVPGADGLKTGHTEAAGYGLMGSAERDGRRVVLVINGLASEKERIDESVRLMEWAFRNFDVKTVAKPEEPVELADVWLGKKDKLPLVVKQNVEVLLPRAHINDMKIDIEYDKPVSAPIAKGDEIGKMRITIPDQSPIEVDLLAGEDVEQKGFFGRLKDKAKNAISRRKADAATSTE